MLRFSEANASRRDAPPALDASAPPSLPGVGKDFLGAPVSRGVTRRFGSKVIAFPRALPFKRHVVCPWTRAVQAPERGASAATWRQTLSAQGCTNGSALGMRAPRLFTPSLR